jgi:hypothetical protein
VDTDPSHEELRAFVSSLLSNFDQLLDEPTVVEEAIREHRDMWVLLYRASLGFDVSDSST